MQAKAKPFEPTKEMDGIADYFADFVPQVVAAAVKEFGEMAAALVNTVKEEAQTASDTMRATLASLGLPASLQAASGETGLPEAVWADIAAVQAKGGGAALENGLRANQKDNSEFLAVLDKATGQLSADASEELRRKQR